MAKSEKNVEMSATDKSGKTQTMTSTGGSKTGKTTTSQDGSIVQTDGNQVIIAK